MEQLKLIAGSNEEVHEKTANHDIFLAKKFFTDLYQKDFQTKYRWDKGKDSKLFMSLWTEGCDEDLKTWEKKVISLRLQILDTPSNKRIFKLRDKETYTIGILSSVWNEMPRIDWRKICKKCYFQFYSHGITECEFEPMEPNE